MAERFDRFTASAQRVFQAAHDTAAQSGATAIGPDHLFMALVRVDPGLMRFVLGAVQGNLRTGFAAMARGGGSASNPTKSVGLSSEAQRAIELAVDEARQRGDGQIGTRHLLTGLVRQAEEAKAGAIFELRLDADAVRRMAFESDTPAAEGSVRLVQAQSAIASAGTTPPEGAATFSKFTERARKVLQLAQEEAQRFNHNYIGTEHLLLGLVREGEGVAARVLANLGVDLNKVRSAVEFIIDRGERTVTGDIGLTPRAKKVIELSVEEALRLGHNYIGTEHLLLGLVREGEGIAAGVLLSLGVSLDKVVWQVNDVLAQAPATSGVPEPRVVRRPTPMEPRPPRVPAILHLDAVLASFANAPDEVTYQDCATGPGYSAGIVQFLPRETGDPRMVTHEAKDVVCHVISGQGFLRMGDEVQEIGPGTLCHIPARTPHDFRAIGEPIVMFVATMDVEP